MNSVPSPETINNLHALALQRIQADITTDKMWMTYNPYILAGCLGIIFICVLIIFLNEFLSHRFQGYNESTEAGINIGAIAVSLLALVIGISTGIGFLYASSDYNYKTQSPDAAAYQQVVNYLYYGARG